MSADKKHASRKNQESKDIENKWQEFAEQEPEPEPEEVHEGLELVSREELEKGLNEMEHQVDEYKDAAIRAKAELENIRRRSERDIGNAHKYGNEKLLSALLPVMDSLTRSLEGPELQDPHLKSMREGMELTLDLFEKTLEKFGVETTNPEPGEAFNPEQHEAMSMQDGPGAESNTVLQVVQKGYLLNGRVLRAAMVVVAK